MALKPLMIIEKPSLKGFTINAPAYDEKIKYLKASLPHTSLHIYSDNAPFEDNDKAEFDLVHYRWRCT